MSAPDADPRAEPHAADGAGVTPAQSLLPPQGLLIALALMAALHFLLPAGELIGSPWRWAGLLPAAIGLTLVLHSAQLFDRVRTTIVPFHRSSTLVTNGFFGISRNPIYLGMVLLLAGVATMLGTLTPWCVPPLFALWIDRRFIVAEERMLTERFGAAYDAYRTRVRRWL